MHVPVVPVTLVVGVVDTVVISGFVAVGVVLEAGTAVSCSGVSIVGVTVVTVIDSGFMVVAVV